MKRLEVSIGEGYITDRSRGNLLDTPDITISKGWKINFPVYLNGKRISEIYYDLSWHEVCNAFDAPMKVNSIDQGLFIFRAWYPINGSRVLNFWAAPSPDYISPYKNGQKLEDPVLIEWVNEHCNSQINAISDECLSIYSKIHRLNALFRNFRRRREIRRMDELLTDRQILIRQGFRCHTTGCEMRNCEFKKVKIMPNLKKIRNNSALNLKMICGDCYRERRRKSFIVALIIAVIGGIASSIFSLL